MFKNELKRSSAKIIFIFFRLQHAMAAINVLLQFEALYSFFKTFNDMAYYNLSVS